jgi:DNA-binding transcriptional LysR family regulator
MEKLVVHHAGADRVAFRSDAMLARIAAIGAGVGLGIAPCFIAERDRGLERLEIPLPEMAGQMWLVIHADLRTNARVRAFVDFAHQALVEQRSRFEVWS